VPAVEKLRAFLYLHFPMNKLLFTVFLLTITLSSFSQKPKDLLLKAYKSNSEEKTLEFFNNWKKRTSLSAAERQKMNDTIRSIYEIFREFYTPDHDVSAEYLLLQNSIDYGIVDTLDKDLLLQSQIRFIAPKLNISVDSATRAYYANAKFMLKRVHEDRWPVPATLTHIPDFKPEVNHNALILTDEYSDLINAFLTGKQRYQFLNKHLSMRYDNGKLFSRPYVTSITFDKSLETAVLNYHVVSDGGYAYFKRNNGKWQLIETKQTWSH
jgi:hypothetical protein